MNPGPDDSAPTCADVQLNLDDYLCGGDASAVGAWIHAHCDACPRCRDGLLDVVRLRHLIGWGAREPIGEGLRNRMLGLWARSTE